MYNNLKITEKEVKKLYQNFNWHSEQPEVQEALDREERALFIVREQIALALQLLEKEK